jgi:hypothetical protein
MGTNDTGTDSKTLFVMLRRGRLSAGLVLYLVRSIAKQGGQHLFLRDGRRLSAVDSTLSGATDCNKNDSTSFYLARRQTDFPLDSTLSVLTTD